MGGARAGAAECFREMISFEILQRLSVGPRYFVPARLRLNAHAWSKLRRGGRGMAAVKCTERSFASLRMTKLKVERAEGNALAGDVELASECGGGAAAERLFGRDAGDVGVVVVLRKMREHEVARLRVEAFLVG